MKAGKILAFLASVLFILSVLGYIIPEEGINVGALHFRFTSLHAMANDERHRSEPIDTAAIEAERRFSDSIAYYRNIIDQGPLRLAMPEPHYLDTLWAAAEQAQEEGRTLRILHYGDSQIEMDHMTGRLRAAMQQTFGGGGPGMIPFSTITPSPSVRQSTTGELIHLSSFGDSTVKRSRGDYGPMMQCFRMATGNVSMTLKASTMKSVDERVKHISSIALIYNSHNPHLSATASDRQHKGVSLERNAIEGGIGRLEWQLDSACNNIRVDVNGSADLYALLADDGYGVAVDNIPMRGCSGQQFTLVPVEKLAAAYRQMDIGLIILQFGGNSVPYFKTASQISTYCRSIGRQIDHVHASCPKAKILFIGPSDMSTRINGTLQTYPLLPQLIDSLSATALAHDAAFWSIYNAMGGEGSMIEWVKQGLAGSDYIHFSQRGADKMGDLLWQALYANYRIYTLCQQHQPLTAKPHKP